MNTKTQDTKKAGVNKVVDKVGTKEVATTSNLKGLTGKIGLSFDDYINQHRNDFIKLKSSKQIKDAVQSIKFSLNCEDLSYKISEEIAYKLIFELQYINNSATNRKLIFDHFNALKKNVKKELSTSERAKLVRTLKKDVETRLKNDAEAKAKEIQDLKDAVKAKIEADKLAFVEQITEEIGTKQVNGKEIKPTKALINRKVNIAYLSDKVGTLSDNDNVKLANLLLTDNVRTLSQCYKVLELNQDILNHVLGAYPFPTFKEFKSKAGIKFEFTFRDGLVILQKFNLNSERAKKAAKQQAKENNK
jgi:hypothetical protein